MHYKHLKSLILCHNIRPYGNNQLQRALRIIKQKEKFIIEDAVRALIKNPHTQPVRSGHYSISQLIREINTITNQYYFLYIQISQFEIYLRTYINHKMIKNHGRQWHLNNVMSDLKEFNTPVVKGLSKPSQALNSISFGTLELVFLNGGRFGSVFLPELLTDRVLNKDDTPKYSSKKKIKPLFSIIRNARNDICHHRRIGESIKSNPHYKKKNMTRSDVINALKDLMALVDYESELDVQQVQLQYRKF